MTQSRSDSEPLIGQTGSLQPSHWPTLPSICNVMCIGSICVLFRAWHGIVRQAMHRCDALCGEAWWYGALWCEMPRHAL